MLETGQCDRYTWHVLTGPINVVVADGSWTVRCNKTAAYPGILFWGGGSTSSVEDRENGDQGAVAP